MDEPAAGGVTAPTAGADVPPSVAQLLAELDHLVRLIQAADERERRAAEAPPSPVREARQRP